MTRRPAERVMLERLRADAWRFDDPAERERVFKEILSVPGRFDAFELNVLYELLLVGSTVEGLEDQIEACPEGEVSLGHVLMTDRRLSMPDSGKSFQVETLPFALLKAVSGLLDDPNWVDPNPWPEAWAASLGAGEPLSKGIVVAWREWTKMMRQRWLDWGTPRAYTTLLHVCQMRIHTFYGMDAAHASMTPLVTLCETLLRICWLFECEAHDALAFGAVHERRLPADQAERAWVLRAFAEQQPELRREPAFVHVAPREPEQWLRPKDYPGLPVLPTTPQQLGAILKDGIEHRKFIHDHVAVIEVDRKPIKSIVLAPETMDVNRGLIFLTALVNHEKGTFCCEVLISLRDSQDGESVALAEASPALALVGGIEVTPHVALSLPFGSHAWRMLPYEDPEERLRNSRGSLPPDEHVTAVIVAAWRDLIVANVREQQYEQETIRGGVTPNGSTRARKAKRHTRVIRYLPRTVVLRRALEAQRAASGSTRNLSTAFRVGAFARKLIPGHHRSKIAEDYARAIGMPLREDQTVVQPHIRGGTEAEREALLAQDDVRLWRSWAAVDLLYAS